MSKRKVCIAIPSYTGQAHLRTMFSLIEGAFDLLGRGYEFTWLFRDHDSMIARARSVMAAQFLFGEHYQDATDLLMADSDLSWNFGALGQVCSHDVDVVGGAYPYKTDALRFPMRWLPGTPPDPPRVNGLFEVEGITPGFFRVTRTALERMTKAYEDRLSFADPDAPNGKAVMLFENVTRPDGPWDEGFIFCERWRALGGKVWVDPDLGMNHTGSKVFSGKLSDYLKQRIADDKANAEKAQAMTDLQRALGELSDMKQIAPLADMTPPTSVAALDPRMMILQSSDMNSKSEAA